MAQDSSASMTLALVGFHSEIGRIVAEALQDEGFTVTHLEIGPATVGELSRQRPALIVVEAGLNPAALTLLDDLRVTPETSAVPVIVLGSIEPVQAQAHAAGNVYAVVPLPFDLDDLLRAATGALARTPFEARLLAQPAETDRASRRAADLLARAERDVMLGWVQRIRTIEPFASRPDLSTREFLDGVPRLLNALILTLRHQTPPDVLTSDEDAQGRIRDHARARQCQGIAAEDVVGEYQALREVIAARLRKEMAAADVLPVLDRLVALLDEVVRVTVAEYIALTRAGQPEGRG